jgi:hypothetical protein
MRRRMWRTTTRSLRWNYRVPLLLSWRVEEEGEDAAAVLDDAIFGC